VRLCRESIGGRGRGGCGRLGGVRAGRGEKRYRELRLGCGSGWIYT
jgi:hypothetical protein